MSSGYGIYTHPLQLEGSPIAPPVVYFDDFTAGGYTAGGAAVGKFSQTANAGEWLTTVTQAGAGDASIVVLDDVPGGVLRILNDAADNDMVNMQHNGEAWKVVAGKDIYYAVRLRVADVSETDWFVGLASTDTSVLGGASETIGFRDPGSTGNINFVVENATVETTDDSGKDLADATFVELGFRVISNNRVKFYVNGEFVGQSTTNLPVGDPLTLTAEVRNDGAVAQSLDLDWLFCRQDR